MKHQPTEEQQSIIEAVAGRDSVMVEAGAGCAKSSTQEMAAPQIKVPALGLAFIEEFMKFSAAYFAVGKSPELDEPIDAMIYMIVAALGFATLENIGAITNVAAAAAQGTLISSVFEAVSLRFVGATLLHSLTSAIVGYHWALGIAHKKVPQYIFSGFVIATILHATFNYLILNNADVGYSVLFLLVIGFFVLNDFERLKVKPA